MAIVRLTADQELPPVCARCGGPTDGRVDHTFGWHPPWVRAFLVPGVLPGLFLMIFLTRRQRMKLPMCDRHRNHWKPPRAATFFGLAASGVLFLLGAPRHHRGLVSLGVVLFVAAMTALAIWSGRRIRADRIDGDGLVLTGVAERFAEEAEKLRDGEAARAYDEYPDDDRPRRPNRYDIDVDER